MNKTIFSLSPVSVNTKMLIIIPCLLSAWEDEMKLRYAEALCCLLGLSVSENIALDSETEAKITMT